MAGYPQTLATTSLSGWSALDPFALPTETEGRYRMLVAAALLVAWSAASYATPGLLLEPEEQLSHRSTRRSRTRSFKRGSGASRLRRFARSRISKR